jgi:hypothetical protein
LPRANRILRQGQGGAAGNALSGGLNDLLKQFQQNGQGEVAQSWFGSGPNEVITPNDLASALGADRLAQQGSLPCGSRSGHSAVPTRSRRPSVVRHPRGSVYSLLSSR